MSRPPAHSKCYRTGLGLGGIQVFGVCAIGEKSCNAPLKSRHFKGHFCVVSSGFPQILFLVKLLIFHGAFIAQSRVQVELVIKVNPN